MIQAQAGRLTAPSTRSRSPLQSLWAYLRPHQQQVWFGIGSLLIVNLISVFLPWYIKVVIDNLDQVDNLAILPGMILTNRNQQVLFHALIILVVASVMMVIRIASRVWMFGVGRKVEFDLKQQLFEHLLSLSPSYFGSHMAGDLISRATSDVDNIRRLLGFAVLSLVNTIFAYALTLPAMLLIDVRLSLLVLMIYPVMLVLVKLTSTRLQREQMEVQQRLSALSDMIQEDMNGISLIKVYGQEQHEQQEFAQQSQQLLDANIKLAITRNWLFPTLVALVGGSLLVLLAVGGPQIVAGEITLGDFSALTLYTERLVFPTALLGFTLTAYQRGQVSIDRVESILDVDPTIQDAEDAVELAQPKGRIKATQLTFFYPEATKPALDQISFRIEPGEMVAIVGPIGSGKSTLANAIPHLLEIDPGQLWIDGQDVTRIQLRSLRRTLAYVPQESFLFNATVMDNIRYGKPDASAWEVELAAKTAQIHAEILNFPQAYETLVGERGITLSGGQRQRVALARALMIDAPILILDDSLSSIDNQTALEILANLNRAVDRKTVIFISHRLTTAVEADQILVMDQGQIIQAGTHLELLRQSEGLYSQLWYRQKLEEVLA